MPTAAECAWEQLCQVVQGAATEEELVLMSLAELRELMNLQGFTPLTAARAEVQWQVLQGTNSVAQHREYAESIRLSPRRSVAGTGSVHGPAPSAAAPTPQHTPSSAAPPQHPATPPTGPRSTPAGHAATPSTRGSQARAASPRRELGSREGVLSPRSLRPLRTPSPSRLNLSPLVHGKAWEAPDVKRGPHLSRRTPLSPRSALVREDSPSRSGKAAGAAAAAVAAASSNPNEAGPAAGSRARARPTGIRSAADSATSPRAPAAAANPNLTSLDRQSPAGPSIKRFAHNNASTDPFRAVPEAPHAAVRYLASDRIPGVGDPNEVAAHHPCHLQPVRPKPAVPAVGNPNETPSATTEHFFARKGRSDKGQSTEEHIPRFVPTPGPSEAGVLPGTHAWAHGEVAEVVNRKRISTRDEPSGVADPNALPARATRFLGGKCQPRRPDDQGVAVSLSAAGTAAAADGGSPPRTQPPSQRRVADPGSPPAASNPNVLSPAGADVAAPSASLRAAAAHAATPADSWGGPGRTQGAAAAATPRTGRVAVPATSPAVAGSHVGYAQRKAEHLVAARPASATSSPRARRGDFAPRYVPGAA